jgi:GH24 family phage-related lysozyme (muramidase)
MPDFHVTETFVTFVKSLHPIEHKAIKIGEQWIIGHGHTGDHHFWRPLSSGIEVDEIRAHNLLVDDLNQVNRDVTALLRRAPDKTIPLNKNQHAALIAFTYCMGMNLFRQSVLLHRVNARRYLEAAAEFLKHTRCPKRGQLRSLVQRRHQEASLFCSFMNL